MPKVPKISEVPKIPKVPKEHEKHDPYPPLVSDRSPTFGSARWEHMHPSPTADPDMIASLNRLVEAEYHAVTIYTAALGVVRAPNLAHELELLNASHDTHRRALAHLVSTLGGAAPRPDECEPVLSRSPDDLRYLPDDAAVIGVLVAVEEEMIERYEDALSGPSLPAPLEGLARHLSEARRMRTRLVELARGDMRL